MAAIVRGDEALPKPSQRVLEWILEYATRHELFDIVSAVTENTTVLESITDNKLNLRAKIAFLLSSLHNRETLPDSLTELLVALEAITPSTSTFPRDASSPYFYLRTELCVHGILARINEPDAYFDMLDYWFPPSTLESSAPVPKNELLARSHFTRVRRDLKKIYHYIENRLPQRADKYLKQHDWDAFALGFRNFCKHVSEFHGLGPSYLELIEADVMKTSSSSSSSSQRQKSKASSKSKRAIAADVSSVSESSSEEEEDEDEDDDVKNTSDADADADADADFVDDNVSVESEKDEPYHASISAAAAVASSTTNSAAATRQLRSRTRTLNRRGVDPLDEAINTAAAARNITTPTRKRKATTRVLDESQDDAVQHGWSSSDNDKDNDDGDATVSDSDIELSRKTLRTPKRAKKLPQRLASGRKSRSKSKKTGGKKARRRWTEDEVNTLRRGVLKFGLGAWAKVLEYGNGFGDRGSLDIRDKVRNMFKSGRWDSTDFKTHTQIGSDIEEESDDEEQEEEEEEEEEEAPPTRRRSSRRSSSGTASQEQEQEQAEEDGDDEKEEEEEEQDEANTKGDAAADEDEDEDEDEDTPIAQHRPRRSTRSAASQESDNDGDTIATRRSRRRR
jgi:hypothetical protein